MDAQTWIAVITAPAVFGAVSKGAGRAWSWAFERPLIKSEAANAALASELAEERAETARWRRKADEYAGVIKAAAPAAREARSLPPRYRDEQSTINCIVDLTGLESPPPPAPVRVVEVDGRAPEKRNTPTAPAGYPVVPRLPPRAPPRGVR